MVCHRIQYVSAQGRAGGHVERAASCTDWADPDGNLDCVDLNDLETKKGSEHAC